MTERFGALSVMVNHQVANVEAYLADFYKRFNGNDLVIDLWFSVQASAEMVTPDAIKSLIAHADFDWNTPNRVRSVISAFASQPTVLWTAEGLDIYTGVIKKLDEATIQYWLRAYCKCWHAGTRWLNHVVKWCMSSLLTCNNKSLLSMCLRV